ncbi:MAG: hypothetical protein FWC00_03320 [Firmicutes bacterium]|nr:hypothetical protein [Bacillota bacterium]
MVSTIMLSLFGLFMLFIAFGVMWGAIRGFRRSLIRLITVMVFFSIALLLTPAFTGPVTSALSTLIKDAIVQEHWSAATTEGAAELINFAVALGGALANLLVFVGLLIVFRGISWIVYAVLCRFFAPKLGRDASGQRTIPQKRYRWAGVGIGVVTGFVFFGFFFIPVNGTIHAINAVANHRTAFEGSEAIPSAVAYTYRDLDDENGFEDFIYELQDINRQIQNSAFGVITRITGFQGMSAASARYLTTVRVGTPEGRQRIHVKSDIVNIGRTVMDVVAIVDDINRDDSGFASRAERWSAEDFDAIENTVERVLNISIVRVLLGFGDQLVPILREEGMLDEMFLDMANISENAPLSERQPVLDAGYNFVGRIASFEAISEDLLNIVNVLRDLFYTPYGSNALWSDLSEIFDNFDDTDAVYDASRNLVGTTEQEARFRGLINTIFNFNIVSALFSEDLAPFYQPMLADMFGINDVECEDTRADMRANLVLTNAQTDFGNLFVALVDSISTVSDLASAPDMFEFIRDDLEPKRNEGIVEVFNILTNSDSIGRIMRTILWSQLAGLNADDMELGIAPESVQNMIDDLVEILSSTPSENPIEWYSILTAMQSMLQMAEIMSGDDDIDLSNIPYLLGTISDIINDGAEFLAPVIVEVIQDQLEGTGISIDAKGAEVEFITIIADLDADRIVDMLEGDVGNANEVLDLFGVDALLELEYVGVRINISNDIATADELRTAINTNPAFATEAERQAVRRLFGV